MSSVNEVGTGAKDSPGDVDATRSNRKPPGDESSPGTRKVDATAEGEGTTPQKVPKNVKIPGEGGSGMIGRMSRPGDESSPGTRKVDATEGEGTTPQKVPKNVKIPGEGGSGMIGRMSRDWASGAKDEPGEAEIKEGGT